MEVISDKKVYSLLEVTLSIQKTLRERYRSSFWVKAEMNKLNHYPHSGHCYPDLVEKREGKVIAQMRANLWKTEFQKIDAKFRQVLKEPLKDGITILFCASIHFDPSHGLFLRITDIDPSYTLGELEREKQETIARLTEEQILRKNKELRLALLPQRIAVISVETSKGYSDYLKILQENPWGYRFFNFLFPSLLQGDRSVDTIIAQLRRIRMVADSFDAVAIIRGGGGEVGLSSFNSYRLAREIAMFPLPVITGIGHSTNETVAEIVAYKNAITPTELADFLIQKFHDFAFPVQRAQEVIVQRSRRLIDDENRQLKNVVRYFQSVTHNRLIRSRYDIAEAVTTLQQLSKFRLREEHQACDVSTSNLSRYVSQLFRKHAEALANTRSALTSAARAAIAEETHTVNRLEKTVAVLDPQNILKRGFTITMSNGKSIKHYSEVQVGDTVTTILADGTIYSQVIAPAEKGQGL